MTSTRPPEWDIFLPYRWKARDYQRPLWEYLRRGGRRAVARWHRRCLASGTHVTLATGEWRRIEELLPGDEILAWEPGKGVVTDRVKAVWPAGVKPVVRVSCAGFPDVVATADHRFWVTEEWRKGRWQQVGTVRQKGATGSRDALSVLGAIPPSHTLVPHAELYGHLVTDGSVNQDQSPKYTNTRPELIARVAALSEAVGVVPRQREKGRGWDLHLSNGRRGGGEVPNPVKELFREEGALEKRGLRRVPRSLWTADHESLAAFFGAVLDGDGSLWLFPGKTAFGGKAVQAAAEVKIHVGESQSLAWDYYWLLRKLGVVPASVTCERETCWTVRVWSRENVLNLLRQVTLRHEPKEALRKQILGTLQDVSPRQKRDGLYRTGATVVSDGLQMTWDIETERTGCFFANGYLVHNSGKDEVFLHHTACAAHERVGNYWYMLPEYSQARKAMWDAVNPKTGRKRIDDAFPHALRKGTREQEMMIVFKNGSTFQLVGSDNFNSLVGSPPVGLVFSEYALSQPSAWSYLMPIIEENRGWAAFNSTPRGKNHFKNLCELAATERGWFYSVVTARDTGIFTDDQLQGILRQLQAEHGSEEYGQAIFDQEYYVSFDAALPGSIWGGSLALLESSGRLATTEGTVAVPHTEGHPVFTGWDLGYDDDTVCWFYQMIDGDIHVIDYFADNFKDVEFYAQMLLNKHEREGYEYAVHWLPHDARPRTLAAGGKSIMGQLTDFNNEHRKVLGAFRIAPRLDVQEGIQAARATFPRCRFDSARTMEGTDHLKAYRREFDDEKNAFSSTPRHDAASHAADAWRTVAVTWKESKKLAQPLTFEEKLLRGNVVGMPFGDIRDRHLRRMREERQGW